jgi:NADPH:quinone reductase-like Zn-dependent oxidoreductase
MVQVVRIDEHGGPDVLKIVDIETPQPGPGEVRIRVKALGLNRAEAMLRANDYIEKGELPIGLGFEAAGIVDAVGEGVEAFAPGDTVSVVPPLSQIRWPAYGEVAIFPQAHVVRHPSSLSWEAAAAVWMQYVTAYGALIDIAKLRKSDFVIITAASSSVGLAAVQIANMVGATPIAVTRTSGKIEKLRQAGAAHTIASEEEDLQARLEAIAGLNGVRVVFDPVGGPAFTPLTAVMSPGGILLEYGALSAEPTPFPLFNVLSKSLTLRGYLIHEITGDPIRLEAAKTFIVDGLRSGGLSPVIDRTFRFDEIAEAHRYLESNQQFGKIVVTL